MAYAEVISLKNTIDRLLNSSDISLVPPSKEILEFAYKEVKSLQENLNKLDSSSSRKSLTALDGQIKNETCKLEDLLESRILNQFLSQSEETIGDERSPLLFSVDLHDLEHEIHFFAERMKKMEENIRESRNLLPQEDDDTVSSRIDFPGKKSKMVGLSDKFQYVKKRLTELLELRIRIYSLAGMAGIGKTTLALEIFEDPLILSHFDCRAWVTVGQQFQLKEISRRILAQVNIESDKMPPVGDEDIAQHLKESLKGRRYLIVLDDVWDKRILFDLKSLFPEYKNGSRVLLTSRIQDVILDAGRVLFYLLKMRLLNNEESWDLFCEKVFGEGQPCPHQLEKAGKKIAENCEGLPLMIVTVTNILSKAEKTPEYWKKVAKKQNSVFMDAYNEILKVLYPSYEYLPQHLKFFFLYMGVFPQDYKIPKSKLINIWIAEGFLEPNTDQTLEEYALNCLKELISNSVALAYENSTLWSYQIKTCGLHSSFRHLCNREVEMNKFFHVLEKSSDCLAEGMKSQRRLSIHNNISFGIKDTYNSMKEDFASTARSLLCYGPYHQYPVPIYFDLRLLMVLDALRIRFYEFPEEVLKLLQLRYLALTYNGNLPSSISKLWKLQFLIVCRHLSIKSSGADPSYLPVEIWDMKELKHLQVMGSDLPDLCGTLLPKLLTLSDVSAHSCSKGVLKRVPKLKKLGIRIELVHDATEPLSFLDHISHLHELEKFKCVIVNPDRLLHLFLFQFFHRVLKG